jgi:hypothetical protein
VFGLAISVIVEADEDVLVLLEDGVSVTEAVGATFAEVP